MEKQRYLILDGLRGVAAVAVLCYHLYEAIAFAAGAPEQQMFHGFLAVDFFFLLSGFVMGYAYDDRWDRMSVREFVVRRIIRLHPMVVMGVVLGAIAFWLQGSVAWDGTSVPVGTLLWATLLGLFLIPASGRMDVRGNTEMFPLNGPHWSLFFEYIGSWIYALVLRRFSTAQLRLWVFIAFCALGLNGFLQGEGFIAYGWSAEPLNMLGGFFRLAFGYPAGLLLARHFRKVNPSPMGKYVFWLTALVLVGLLSVPNLGDASMPYQLLCLSVLFPFIIWFGARGAVSELQQPLLSWLGRISYPLYAIHYPLIYLYISWISAGNYPFGLNATTTPIAILIVAPIAATLLMFCYDEPLRRWCTKKSQSF